jgi:DNA-binding CsgD family transcriptional regulator
MVPWPLTGRAEELAEVLQSLRSDAVAGVVIAGAAGVGKTRLAREAVEALRADGFDVEWVAATYAAAVVPLSVFAHLVPAPSDHHTEPIDVFRSVVPALRSRAEGRKLVLVVDDSQLLDDASAALLLQLAGADVVRLLLTLRSGSRVPDALVALWKDRFVNRIELQPLGRNDTADLLADVLGGGVDGSTAERAWRVTGGNVLYVRELVDDLLRTGALHDDHGVWRWEGPLAPGARLVELVHGRLDRLGEDERLAVDLLAVAERLETAALIGVCGSAAVARLEDESFITVDHDDRRTWASLVHPVYGDVLRATLARTRWAELCGRLFAILRHTGVRRAGDVLRLVVWAREAGIDVDADVLVEAATHANALTDRALAERLGRAALDLGPSGAAALAVGEALVSMARYEDAIAVLEGASGDDDATRARLAHWHAMAVECAHDDPDRACDILAAASGEVTERRWADFLLADRASILAQSGRDAVASGLAEHLFDDDSTDDIVRLRAITPVGRYWAVSGQAGRAADAARGLVSTALRHAAELPRGIAWVFHTRAMSLLFLGDLDGLDRLLERVSGGVPHPEGAPHVVLYRGRVSLLRGRLIDAAAELREAAGGLPERSPERQWTLALLSETHAYLGDPVTAERFRREAAAVATRMSGFFASDVARATSWAWAANGELTRAREALLETAQRCRDAAEPGMELHVLYDALRLGARQEVAGRLRELTEVVDGAWASTFADHAEALVKGDGAALDAVAERLEEIGALRYAAEASAQAAVAHQRSGLVARAAASGAAAAQRLARCDGSVVPVLPVVDVTAAALSRREEEIARLAAGGLSNREIADRLCVSVRTVEGHLHRLYAKLGVNDRSDLAALVPSPVENA